MSEAPWREKTIAERIGAILDANFDANDERGPKSWEQLCSEVGELTRIINRASWLKGEMLRLLVDLLPEYEVVVDGAGLFTRSNGSKRTQWDGRLLAHRIAARAADEPYDPETGERRPPAVIAAMVADELLATGGLDRPSHQWKTGELKKRGLSPDDFCATEPGTPTVRFTLEAE